jgi:uncharacterized integral membrane protein (TIGR00698 family)
LGVADTGSPQGFRSYAPGIALALALACAASLLEPLVARLFPLPALVIALIAGIWLHPFAARPLFASGLKFCVSKILRIAVALLGLRVALGDIAALGATSALIVVIGMAATILAGVGLARVLGLSNAFGALAGSATAVCGASAALATQTVLPDYKGKEADTVFVIVGVNLLSTIAMLAYPPLAHALGFGDQLIGVMLGGTIHDVAQVVGAGFSVSETTGGAAVVVKLFRVLLLLPVILIIGYAFARRAPGAEERSAKVPLPVFAFGFLFLCVINSIVPSVPGAAAIYAPLKSAAGVASTWGLLLAIAALGLGTSAAAITRLGWRHVVLLTGVTLVILATVAGSLMLAIRMGLVGA